MYHYISETGAGGVISTHTAARLPAHTVNVYEPEEYQQEVAESRCQTVFRNAADTIPLVYLVDIPRLRRPALQRGKHEGAGNLRRLPQGHLVSVPDVPAA